MVAATLVSFFGPGNDDVYRKFVQLGAKDFYPSRDKVPNDAWVDWLERAQRVCILLGVAHGEWVRDDRFKPALFSRLLSGVRVEIFFLDPMGQGVKLREQEDRQPRSTTQRIKKSITGLWRIRAELTEDAKKQLKIYVYDGMPSLGVTWIDEWMLVTHYLSGFNNLTSPALRVESSADPRSPYAVYALNVERIRNSHTTKELDETNFHDYVDEEQSSQ